MVTGATADAVETMCRNQSVVPSMRNLLSGTSLAKRLTVVAALPVFLLGCSSAEQRAQKYYENAEKFLAANDYPHAEIEFKNAIKAKKNFLPAYRGLATADEHQQQWSELPPVWRTIVELDPQDLDTKLKLGRLLLYGNATEEAKKLVSTIDAPNNADLQALKAGIAFKSKDPATAVADANAALTLDPNNVDAIMLLAAVSLQNGDASGALATINKVPAANANDLRIQLFRLRIFQQQRDAGRIEAQLRNLINQYPKQLAFHQQLVRFYLEQNRMQDAESELRSFNQSADVELELVRLLYATKGPEAAKTELATRMNAGGDVFPYQMALADVEYAQHDVDVSFKLLNQLASDKSSEEHALAAKLKLAQFQLDQKNADEAEKLVAEILRSDNRNIGALKLRATIEMNRAQFEPAINDLRSALNDQRRSVDLMMLMATAYERSGAIELADKQLADAMQASNYDTGVALTYVAFLQRRGNAQRGEDVLSDMVTRKPTDVRILTALAQAKLARRDWVVAQEIGDKILKLGAANGVADQILGAALGGQNQIDQSVAAFQDAVTAAPTAAPPMASLVREYLIAKKPDRAIAFLQGVLKKDPANAEALVLLGSVQIANNTPDQAMRSFQTAIDKQPKDVNGYRALAELYTSQHDVPSAIKVVQAGLQQIPDNFTLHMTLAGIYETSGNYEDAIKEYESILVVQPGSLVAANNLASLLADHRSDKGSLERAETLVKSLRQSPVGQFKDTIGWVNYRAGDYRDAVPILEQAVAQLPNVPIMRYHLGMSYLATGQTAKAADEFRTALSQNPSRDLADNINVQLKKTATE
jgi:tetratricopeptide (TPR) repeat protein